MEGRVIEHKRELTKDVEGLEKEVVSFLNTESLSSVWLMMAQSMEFQILMISRSASHSVYLRMYIHHALASSISKWKLQRVESIL